LERKNSTFLNYGALHELLLEIIGHIDEICRAHNIPYFLTGGSALGAIRHRGFIPWDDDIDLMMLKEDYYRFLRACQLDLDTSRFYLDVGGTKERPMPFTKVRRNGTKIKEKLETLKQHEGVFIDIFPLYRLNRYKSWAMLQWVASRMVIANVSSKMGPKFGGGKKKIAQLIGGLFSESFIDKCRKFAENPRGRKGCQFVNLYHRGAFKNNLIPEAILGEPKYVPFEHLFLPIPRNINVYLQIRFGEKWYLIPDRSQQKSTHLESLKIDDDLKK